MQPRFLDMPTDSMYTLGVNPPESAPRNDPPAVALFIAYHYPPIRSTGTTRSQQFVHFLPEFGYTGRVLTTSAFGSGSEPALRAWEPLGLYRRWSHRGSAMAEVSSGVRSSGRLSSIVRWVARRLLVPDAQISWLPHALWRGLRLVHSDRPVLIYSSFPPASAHLLALVLKRVTGLPWVADFRDSWIYDPLDPEIYDLGWRRRLEGVLERAVVHAADRIVCATDISAEYLRTTYPSAAGRVEVITNGHDADPAVGRGPSGPGPLRIVHTGSFALSHPQRTPGPLFAALEALVARDACWAQRLRLILIGPLSAAEARTAQPLRDAGVVEIHGAMDRSEVVRRQREADLLLVVDHPRPWPASNVPGKLYEYMAARRPVLALCGEGMVERMMTKLGAGFTCRPDDPEVIGRSLAAIWDLHDAGRLPAGVDEGVLRRFHRRALTAQLAACFDRARRPES